MVRNLTAVLVLTLACGCGYTVGPTARRDIQRLSVPVFANRTFYRGLEQGLTQAVTAEVEKITPYRLWHGAGADAVLEGEITAYSTPVLAENALDQPTELETVITVKVVLREIRTGKVLFSGTVREAENFAPPAGENEIGARSELFRRVARLIVERAFEGDW